MPYVEGKGTPPGTPPKKKDWQRVVKRWNDRLHDFGQGVKALPVLDNKGLLTRSLCVVIEPGTDTDQAVRLLNRDFEVVAFNNGAWGVSVVFSHQISEKELESKFLMADDMRRGGRR